MRATHGWDVNDDVESANSERDFDGLATAPALLVDRDLVMTWRPAPTESRFPTCPPTWSRGEPAAPGGGSDRMPGRKSSAPPALDDRSVASGSTRLMGPHLVKRHRASRVMPTSEPGAINFSPRLTHSHGREAVTRSGSTDRHHREVVVACNEGKCPATCFFPYWPLSPCWPPSPDLARA